MTKFIITMLLCSSVSGNDCKPFQPEITEFKTYSECARYGYKYASKVMTDLNDTFIEEYRAYIVFSCKENQTI